MGRSPTRPMAWRTKKRRSGGTRLTAARPMSRDQPERLDVVGEQAVQQVGRGDHGEVVGAPPARVALERVGGADVEAEPLGVDQHLDQGGDVAHAEIVALARDRMDAVRGVAHQHQARVDVALGMDQPERKPPARAGRLDVAEIVAEAARELGLEARRRRARAGACARSARSVQTIDERCSPVLARRASAGWRRARPAGTSPGRRRDAAARGAPPARSRSGRTTRRARRCRPPRASCRSGLRPRRPGARRDAGRSSARVRRCRGRALVSTTSSGATSSTCGQACSRRSRAARRKRFSTIQPIGAGSARPRRRPRGDRNAGTAGSARPSWPASEMRMSRIGSAWSASSSQTPSAANRRWLV